jgi:D-alanyl-D-alanine carboxypeptidase
MVRGTKLNLQTWNDTQPYLAIKSLYLDETVRLKAQCRPIKALPFFVSHENALQANQAISPLVRTDAHSVTHGAQIPPNASMNCPYKSVDPDSSPITRTVRSSFELKKQRLTDGMIDEEYTPAADNYPYVSCESYIVIDADRNKSLHAKKDDKVREIASLTKIMTALVSILLAKELKVNLHTTFFTVSKDCAGCCGTTAFLVTD